MTVINDLSLEEKLTIYQMRQSMMLPVPPVVWSVRESQAQWVIPQPAESVIALRRMEGAFPC